MPDLSAVIRADYITRLAQAGIPVQPSQRTADQQAAANMLYLGLTLEVSADSRLTQDILEVK